MISVGSLFSGVGGIDLGLEWAGLGPVSWQVERDPWRRVVLARHWPGVERFDDVRTVGAATLECVDLVAGGFPCRGTSSAGLRTGLAHPESGLWYEFARVVRELRPGAVLVENPASGRRRWLGEARDELEAAGYATRDVGVSAREVGSPQFRPRTFLLAKRRTGVSDGDGDPLRKQPRRFWREDGEGKAIVRAALYLRGYWLRRLGVPDSDAIRRGEVFRAEFASAGRTKSVGSGGVGVSDGEGGGRRAGAGVGTLRQGESVASGGGRERAPDADTYRREAGAHEEQIYEVEPGGESQRRDRDDGAPEPGLGRVIHGISAGLDGRGRWRWPAALGLPQHSWEAPKLRPAVRGDNRRRRVAALGDSCVPACAFVAALALIDWLADAD